MSKLFQLFLLSLLFFGACRVSPNPNKEYEATHLKTEIEDGVLIYGDSGTGFACFFISIGASDTLETNIHVYAEGATSRDSLEAFLLHSFERNHNYLEIIHSVLKSTKVDSAGNLTSHDFSKLQVLKSMSMKSVFKPRGVALMTYEEFMAAIELAKQEERGRSRMEKASKVFKL